MLIARASIEQPSPAEIAKARATSDDTIQHLLTRSHRRSDAVPIAKTFLQQGRGSVRAPGPLAALVRRHDERALDLFLLARAVATSPPYDITEAAAVWARTLDLSASETAKTAVSKAFARLEKLQLIVRSRNGRRLRVTLLADDGEGGPYVHPHRSGALYLQLPYDYWRRGYHRSLGLRAKAVLLIARSLADGFPLPAEKVRDWYGISPDTFERGVEDLQSAGLLAIRKVAKSAPCTDAGFTIENRYTLRPPLGPRGVTAKGAFTENRS